MSSKDDYFRYGESWVKSTFTGNHYDHPQFAEIKANNGRFWADFVPRRNVYIGPNLEGRTLGQDLGIRGPGVRPVIGSSEMLRYFDSTWTATAVNPADPWFNQVTASLPGGPVLSTQSENLANYRGWATRAVTLMTDADPANMPALTESRTWDNRSNEAYALVCQAKLWNDSIVATAGTRHDGVSQTNTVWNREESTDDPTQIRPTVRDSALQPSAAFISRYKAAPTPDLAIICERAIDRSSRC